MMRTLSLLSRGDIERLFDLIDLSHTPRPIGQLHQTLSSRLRDLLPHAGLARGRADSGGNIVADFRTGFASNENDADTSVDIAVLRPLVRTWVKTREPVYFESQPPDMTCRRQNQGMCSELTPRIGLHGVASITGGASCYAFVRLEEDWGPRAAALLRIITPHLHVALSPRPTTRSSHGNGTTLSRSELTVLRCLVLGKTNKEAGALLGVSPWTVKNQVHSILRKLDATTRAHAVAKAIQLGMVGYRDFSARHGPLF